MIKIKLEGGPSNGTTLQFGTGTNISGTIYVNGYLYSISKRYDSDYYVIFEHHPIKALNE